MTLVVFSDFDCIALRFVTIFRVTFEQILDLVSTYISD